jgi:taurine transport system substrate-binding protein
MGALQHEGIAESDVTIIGMKPDQIAASWDQDAIDAAWIWQPVQSELLKSGTLVIGADQVAAWGFPTYDGWVVNGAWGQAHKAEVVAFLKEIDKVNKSYLSDPAAWNVDSAEVKALAAATGADVAQVPDILKGFTFLPMSDQISATWLGGAAPIIKSTADFLKGAGRIDNVVDDYSPFVNAEFATEAAK